MIRMSIGRRRARHVLGWGLATGLLLTVVPIVPQAAQAAGSITASRDANAVTSALTMTSGVVTSAAFDAIPPTGNPAAVSTQPLTAFPSDSSSYAILSTGDATQAGVNDQSQFISTSDGGGNLRGNTDYDATVLKIGLNVPSTANCLQFDFQFLSEEFPEFKGSAYNDAFIAELDSSNWTTSGSQINAPNNFALDDSNPPSEVSVNSLGDTRVTAGQAAGTIYDGATFPLVASKTITPGVHNLYLSLFDQGDSIYDSAVFVDGLRVGPAGPGGCGSGARREISNLAMTATPSTTPTGIVTSDLADVPMTGVAQHSSTANSGTAPFGKAPFGKAPFGKAPFGKAPFGKAPFGKAPFGKAPFGKAPFGKAPFGKAPFGKAPLSEYPLLRSGGWPLVLSHTCAYTDATPQSVSWQQLFADGCAPETGTSPTSTPPPIQLDEILISASPLADFPLLAYLLGGETWTQVSRPTGSWQGELTQIPSCTLAATKVTTATYTIGEAVADGCQLEDTTLANRHISDLTNKSATAFWNLTLSELNIKGSFLGDIRVADIPSATRGNVVNCSLADCNSTTLTLRDIANSVPTPGAAGNWAVDAGGNATGTFADLGSAIDNNTLSDLVIAFLDPNSAPIEDTPLTDFGFERLTQGNPTNLVTYNASLSVQCLDAAGLKVHVSLPPEFAIRPNSSFTSLNGDTYAGISDPTKANGELTWNVSSGCAVGDIGKTNLALRFDAMPGFTLGTFTSSISAESSQAPLSNLAGVAPVSVTDSSEPDASTISVSNDSIAVGHLAAQGDVDSYSFDVPVGDSLEVSLSHLSRDYQLVLYAPNGSDTSQSLRPSTPARELPIGTEPQVDPSGTNTGILPPPALQDIPLSSGKVLAGISDFRSTDPEFLTTTGVAGTGGGTTYVAQVSGANAAHGNEPYVLTIRTSDPIQLPPAPAVTLPSVSPSGAGMPTVSATTDTLVLFDYQRTTQFYGTQQADAIQSALSQLGSSTVGANSVVVPLDSSSSVRNAFTAWDADPANPQKMNDVTRAINAAVDSLKTTANNNLANVSIVIVGDGSVIPHAAIPDGTADGNEQGFTGDTILGGQVNYMTGALARGYFLSDAPYGTLVPLSIRGQFVYLPQVPVGRLGGTVNGTQNDIVDAIRQFIASKGAADPRTANTEPRTAFESDYDWFADGGDLIARALNSKTQQFDRLSPNGTPANATWTRQQFADEIGGGLFSPTGVPGIISPNGHFDQYRMLPAHGAATNNVSDVYSTANLPNNGRLSPTIIGGGADLNGDGVVDPQDDSTAFFGDASIIDGKLDCNGWTSANDGRAGDGVIDASDDCTLLAYNGTANGATITVTDGSLGVADGPLPTIFPAPSTPNNTSAIAARFAWSVIGGRVDSNGDGSITGTDCHFGLAGGANVLGSDASCGFAHTIPAASNGLVDLNGDDTITAADSCDSCLLGRSVTNGAVDSFLSGSILFSIGCHFGLDFPDQLPGATANDPRLHDWAQALADHAAAVQVGNYGYGIGDTATAGFQELILGDFANRLGGNQSIGGSLLAAEQSYFASMPSFTPYDLKVLQELATWGMPTYTLNAPAGTSGSGGTFAGASSGILNVSALQTTITSSFVKETTNDNRAFFSNNGLTQATHPYPIVPKVTEQIPPTSGQIAHGALPVHWNPINETVIGSGFATNGYAFANATYDNSTLEDAPAAQTVYPTTFGNIGTFYGADGNPQQTLVALTGQFRSNSTGDPAFGTFRAYPSGDWQVLSSANTTDLSPPTFTSVNGTLNGTSTDIAVRVSDGAGVGRVLVQALKSDNSYAAIDLTRPDPSTDPTLWTATAAFQPREMTVFAVDNNGNVGTANNGGPGYIPASPDAGAITLSGNQANGIFTGPVTVSVSPQEYKLTIDSTTATPLQGPLTVSTEGHHVARAYTAQGVPTGTTAAFDIDTTGPTIVIDTPAKPPVGKPLPMYPLADGNPALAPTARSLFTCSDGAAGSGILSCVDQNGKPSNTPLDTSTLGIHTLTVFARDNAGHITTASAQYEVVKFSGFFTPVDNPPVVNSAKAGAGVPIKFRLQRLQGGVLVAISDPTAIANVTAVAQVGGACSGTPDPIETTTGTSGLQYLGDGNWQFNWSTLKSYATKCVQMNLNLWDAHFKTDGSPRGTAAAFALFKFK
jgi:hypothetical protein